VRANKAIYTIFKDNAALWRNPKTLGSKEKWLWMRLAMGDIFRANNDIEEINNARDTQRFAYNYPEAAAHNPHRDFAVKAPCFRDNLR
jgi:predicted DNA binding protein